MTGPGAPAPNRNTGWKVAAVAAGCVVIGVSLYSLLMSWGNKRDVDSVRDSYQGNDAALESTIQGVNSGYKNVEFLAIKAYNLSQQNNATLDSLDKRVSQAAVDAVYMVQLGKDLSDLKEQIAKAGPEQYNSLVSDLSTLKTRMDAVIAVSGANREDVKKLYGQFDSLAALVKAQQLPSPTPTPKPLPTATIPKPTPTSQPPTATPPPTAIKPTPTSQLPTQTPTPTKFPYALPQVFTINYENKDTRQVLASHAAGISSALGLKQSALETITNGISAGEAELQRIVVDQAKNTLTLYERKDGIDFAVNFTGKANIGAKGLVGYMIKSLTPQQLEAIVK